MDSQVANSIFLLLGSNIDPEINLPQAANLLNSEFPVLRNSSIWESPPYGMGGALFLNAVVEICSTLAPLQLKFNHLRKIEEHMGRIRTGRKYSARTIDIDIIAIGNNVVDPETWMLSHIAVPLSELVPQLTNPVTGTKIITIANDLIKVSKIKKRLDLNLLSKMTNSAE